jgi:PDDEXK-like domain of unknown function (DUF3799)
MQVLDTPHLADQQVALPLNQLIPSSVLSLEAYHASEGYSSSSLKAFSRTPWHALWEKTHPTEPTAAMQRGTMLHAALLEPQLFHASYACAEMFTGTGMMAKNKALREANPGVTLIDHTVAELLTQGCDAVRAHKQANAILADPRGVAEQSIFWRDKETGLLLKVRPDFHINHPKIVNTLDVKSAEDASPYRFASQAEKLQYHVSAAMYVDGISQVYPNKEIVWQWLAVEMGTQQCALYTISDADLARGHDTYRKYVRSLKHCLTTGVWPGYQPDGIAQQLRLPNWR